MRVDANHRVPVDAVPPPQSARPPTAPEFSMLNAACSSALAKASLEKTFGPLSPLQKLLLARQLGYDSFHSMLAASTVATLSDGSSWWLTADRNGAWTAWNLCQLDFRQIGESDGDAPLPRKPR